MGAGGPEQSRGDIDEYLRAYSAGDCQVTRTVGAVCASCEGIEFRVRLDDEQGCAERTCTGCGTHAALLDSQEFLEEADLGDAACPCGGEQFNLAVGFAPLEGSDDVRWVYLGLRCTRDGVLGCYADWKIDYTPSGHLYASV